MTPDDETARKARADRLRKQIDAMTGAAQPAAAPEESAAAGESTDAAAAPPSPREFIQKRMRELKEKEQKD
jgi:hypothetical protein